MNDAIKIRGARQHNLKNIDLDVPKNKLVVFTGLSGSGKSSLAFDTIYAEGQRRYVESLSSYARQFLGIMNKPDVDGIEGLSPAISIDQKSTSHNPRSTVGTITEIYDYLRLLFARIGHPHCPVCGREIERQTVDQIADHVIDLACSKRQKAPVRFLILAPVVRDRKGEFSGLFGNLRSKGYQKARIDGIIFDLESDITLIKTNKHTIEVVVDKITYDKVLEKDSGFKSRLTQSIEQGLALSQGLIIVAEVMDSAFNFPDFPKEMIDHLFSERFACPVDNVSLEEIEPRSFSFNSPHGACPTCSGIGALLKVDPELVINPKLTISEGGLLPYSKIFFKETWFSRLLKTVFEENQIPVRIPIRDLSKPQLDTILYGTKERMYTVVGQNRFGRPTEIVEVYQGVITDLERRHRETESDFVRAEIEKFMRQEICPQCQGARLKKEALSVTIDGKTIVDVTSTSISQTREFIEALIAKVNNREATIARSIVKEIIARLSFLVEVGLDYLSLGRGAATLSGGEAQRIRLASQIGSGLSGVLYVLDEPSIGLHPRDNRKLITTLKRLRDLGNSVLVVEHDREIMEEADAIFDFGPGAGDKGGNVVAFGSPDQLKQNKHSITGPYLKNSSLIQVPHTTHVSTGNVRVVKARQNNLKGISVDFPLNQLVCITGVSGSGKSTLVVETLYHGLMQQFNPFHKEKPGAHDKIEGVEQIDKVILVDQSPIGRTPRSNPATYTGLFTFVRELFATLPEAKQKGYGPGRFSFNVKGGRCEACQGEGQIKIEMQFLSDVYVTCEVCHGSRYNSETLDVRFKDKSIADILSLTVTESLKTFENIPHIYQKLVTLHDVGLGYIHLGQPAPTLSGGEAQRVKLAAELSKRQTGKTVYILDEPTTGLHFADLEKLLRVLIKLTVSGNTVIVIEHNLDVIRNADYIIDLGPDGGDGGGKVVATGSPHEIAQTDTYTGVCLKQALAI